MHGINREKAFYEEEYLQNRARINEFCVKEEDTFRIELLF